MLTSRCKPLLDQALGPLARRLVVWRVSPSALTMAGLICVAASCAILLLTQRVLLFCALAAFASLFDALDGAVARAGGRATKSGAYLDAVCDRYAETLIILSVARVTGYWLLSGLVLAGALLVSYAKARAAMEVAVSNLEWPDLMERPERMVVYVIGLAASRLMAWAPLGRDLFWWTLVALAVLVHATAIQRIRRAMRLIRARA